ncbi:MAG: BON domain-containing protein [Pseudomonadota bacterium]
MRVPTVLISLLLATALIQGCAPAVVATAATGAMISGDRRSAEAILRDKAIEMKANDAIYSDPYIGTSVHVNIVSYNGLVLITGEAPSPEVRAKVEEMVRDSDASINTIHNEIIVGPNSDLASRSRDSLMTATVKAHILRNTDVDPTKIKVVTENATVYLLGLVTEEEAERASRAVSQVKNVDRVVRAFEYISPSGEVITTEEKELDPRLHQEENSMILEKIDEIMTKPQPLIVEPLEETTETQQ